MFLVIVARLRSFYSVILGTFVLSYMGNTVIGLAMDKGNKALKGLVHAVLHHILQGALGLAVAFHLRKLLCSNVTSLVYC